MQREKGREGSINEKLLSFAMLELVISLDEWIEVCASFDIETGVGGHETESKKVIEI